jgi:hypothetical protein
MIDGADFVVLFLRVTVAFPRRDRADGRSQLVVQLQWSAHSPAHKRLLGLRHHYVSLPVLLHTLPSLHLFRSENRGDLAVVFGVNCLQ